MKKVLVMGLGYIGLPTAVIAAEHGFDVVGFDIDAKRVNRINNSDPVIDEPEVYERLKLLIETGRFHATTALETGDCFIIAVPTPFKEHKKADLSYVYKAIEQIAGVIKQHNLVIIESTIPVGTTDFCATLLEQKTGLKAGIDFFIAHCPERVIPGKIFYELVYNDRIIGGINEASMHKAKEFYKQFVKGDLYLTNATAAEMVKLVENSSRDVSIAFSNQVAAMAYSVGLDPFEIIELANKHPRVQLLNPSCGVGGHCIAVDPWFLIETFPAHSALLATARTINDEKPYQVTHCVRSWVLEWHKKYQKKPTVLALGLTYKADVNDLRESPALEIVNNLLLDRNLELLVCEPHVESALVNHLTQHHAIGLEQGIAAADIIVCLVNHTAFNIIDPTTLAGKKILDFCGLFYKSHQQGTHQEHYFWPASNTLQITPFEPQVELKHVNTLYKEQVS